MAHLSDIIEAFQHDLLSDVIQVHETVFIMPVLSWDGKEYDPEEDRRRILERNEQRDKQMEQHKKMMFDQLRKESESVEISEEAKLLQEKI